MSAEWYVGIVVAFALGALLAWFYAKINHIDRKKFDTTNEALLSAQNALQSKEDLYKDTKQKLSEIEQKWHNELAENQRLNTEVANADINGNNLREQYTESKQNNHLKQQKIEEQNQQILDLNTQLAKIKTQQENLSEKLKNQDEDFKLLQKQSLADFKLLANRLFEDNSNKFSQQSKEKIEQLLNPLRENLQDFKKKVEDTYDKEAKARYSLEDRIKELVALNQQISKDANNLTNALKGQAKTQGDWGEMILENILEHSGLVKNREYFIQESYQDENGKRKQPDVTIKYPNNRYIIIDSKVSLTAYERFANCENKEEQKLHLAKHIESIKSHINNLSSKEYDKIDKSLDFVMLFVPIEPAYITAVQYDKALWNFAYKQRILLISPTNLIAALKMVADIWKREKQNLNASKIAKAGENLYDKLVGFVNDMEEIDKNIKRLNTSYANAVNKLSTGKGNLINRAQNLKTMGINPKKQLPEKWIENSGKIDNNNATELPN